MQFLPNKYCISNLNFFFFVNKFKIPVFSEHLLTMCLRASKALIRH